MHPYHSVSHPAAVLGDALDGRVYLILASWTGLFILAAHLIIAFSLAFVALSYSLPSSGTPIAVTGTAYLWP